MSRVRMRLDVMLGGFASMMIGLEAMTMRNVRVMARKMMLTFFVVLGGFTVMLGGLLVMVGGGFMMIGFVQSGHFLLPRSAASAASGSLPGEDAKAVTFI
jgi:hypothetical protein